MKISTSTWQNRIDSSNRFYAAWKNLFRCEILEKYWEGHQWNSRLVNYQPYVLNMVYSTIKSKLGNILFQRPQFTVDPVPAFADWDLDFAVNNSYLKADALNTIIRNRKVNFSHNIKLAAMDSFTRFGIIEVGYAADWRNPNKIPFSTDHEGKVTNRAIAKTPVPQDERVYFKHIKASRFRVAAADASTLDQSAWLGYYEYRFKSDLANTKGIKLPNEYKAQYIAADYGDISSYLNVENKSPEMWSLISKGEVLKVWHIYDQYNKEYNLFLDNLYDEPLFQEDYDEHPFSDIRWDLRMPSLENQSSSGWYPIPPVWQWISPQDEINRAREQLRNYRRRFSRKWWYINGKVDPTEMEKLKTEEDGVAIAVKQPDAIGTIANPDIGTSIQESLSLNMSDMNMITGTSAEARGDGDRQTATESKIIDIRQQVRESVEQLDFSNFICDIGRRALKVMKERFSEGLWVKYTAEQGMEGIFQELQEKKDSYKWVSAQDLDDGYDEEIAIDIQNATPAQMQQAKQTFLEFLAIVNQYPQIAMSPILIREAAYRVGYRNEKIIKQMQQMAILHMMGQIAQQQQAQGQQPGAGISNNNTNLQNLNSNPNPASEINSQLQQQLTQ